jgi:hypothetical protein
VYGRPGQDVLLRELRGEPLTADDRHRFGFPDARSACGYLPYGTGGASTVNLYALAAANGNTATVDPLIDKLLTDIENATKKSGTINALSGNFVAQRLRFQQDSKGLTRYPTVRMDYNLTSKHKLNFSTSHTRLNSNPDTTNTRQTFFPGFPIIGAQIPIALRIRGPYARRSPATS